MIRYAGLFCNRWKGQYLSQARAVLNQPDTDESSLPSWAERQSDYTGIDPLTCPSCKQPLTFIGVFFGDWNFLKLLFESAYRDSTIPIPLLRPG